LRLYKCQGRDDKAGEYQETSKVHCALQAGLRCGNVTPARGLMCPGLSHSWNRPVRGLRRCIIEASWAAMFVIELIYKTDLAEIDAYMTAHVKFLKQYYASGHFLVSGRKIPRDGGIILAVGKSRAEIEAIMRHDPFFAHGLADLRIIEFRASQRADNIQERIEA
jgi:uncharacterized protein YciI